MPEPKPKPKKVGRPKLSDGGTKEQIIPVRFNSEDIKCITTAARVSGLTVAEWIRERIRKDIHGG